MAGCRSDRVVTPAVYCGDLSAILFARSSARTVGLSLLASLTERMDEDGATKWLVDGGIVGLRRLGYR